MSGDGNGAAGAGEAVIRRWPPSRLALAALAGLAMIAFAAWAGMQVRAEVGRAGLLQEARQAMSEGDYDVSMRRLDELLAANPDDQEALQLRASAARTRRLVGLLQEAREASQDMDWDLASDRLETLRDTDISFGQPEVNEELCYAYQQKGLTLLSQFARAGRSEDLAEAASAFAKGISVCPEDETLWSENHLAGAYLEGVKSLQKQEWEVAISNFQSILTSRQDYAGGRANEMLYQTYLKKGDSLYQQGELNKALVEYINALEVPVVDQSSAQERRQSVLKESLCASYLDAGLSLVDEYTRDGELSHLAEALQEFERSLQVCPDDTAVTLQRDLASYYLQGRERYESEEWREAISALSEVYKLRRNYLRGEAAQQLYQAYLNRGNQKYEASDFNGALAEYLEALKLSVSSRSEAEAGRDRAKAALATPSLTPIPTIEPQPSYSYPQLRLTAPESGIQYQGEELPLLRWQEVGGLAYNEYYVVAISGPDRAGERSLEQRWVKEASLALDAPPASGEGAYEWWVTIRRLTNVGPDGSREGVPLSPPSEHRTFTWSEGQVPTPLGG